MAAWGYGFYLLVLKVSLTRSLRSGTRERYFHQSKIKFVSPRGHVISSIYVRNFLSLYCIFIFLSIYFKIVLPQVCFSLLSSQATCRSRRCYRNREKGTATSQKPNLCLWGTWKFAPKNIRSEKIPRQITFISINAVKRYFARFLKRCT